MNLNQVTLPALDRTVRDLQAKGILFTQAPRDEPCAPAPDGPAP